MDSPQLQESGAAPPRVAPLAKLPVFWALEGRRVVIAGGSDACAWKAELLAACGARVEIHAGRLDKAARALIERGASHPAGSIVWSEAEWSAEIVPGAELAIGDFVDDEEACAFSRAARAAGVPANVIDKPDFCRFQFGAIVNRSPVLVSISSDGAAPIMAQAIRRRIEALLPPALRQWAELARELRGAVNDRLAPGPARRVFWEGFVDRVFSTQRPPASSAAAGLMRTVEGQISAAPVGRVTLVGAGPGDAEYLTLKAMRVLQSADIVLFDTSISGDILELARREAMRQAVDAEQAVAGTVRHCRDGRHVVRLVPGDAAGAVAREEIERLQAANIPVEIVPGITMADEPVSASVASGQCAARPLALLEQLPFTDP